MIGGISGHERQGVTNVDWCTPPEIIEALGGFSLDPCAAENMFYTTAHKMLTKKEDGFNREWEGRVWLNPPYGRDTEKWMKKMAKHGFGTALIFARTETKIFHPWVWEHAKSIFFFKGRLRFYTPEGKEADHAGAPSCLIAYGKLDDICLFCAKDKLVGRFVTLR